MDKEIKPCRMLHLKHIKTDKVTENTWEKMSNMQMMNQTGLGRLYEHWTK